MHSCPAFRQLRRGKAMDPGMRSVTGFAVRAGEPVSVDEALLVIEPSTGLGQWSLMAAAQPVVFTLEGHRSARMALGRVATIWRGLDDEDVSSTLMKCFAGVHSMLRAEAARGHADPVELGLAVIAVRGTEAIVVQSPPVRLIVASDSAVLPVPQWDSWGPPAETSVDDNRRLTPLGGQHVRWPAFRRLTLKPDSMIVLCDSGTGEAAWQCEQRGTPFRTMLHGTDPDAALDLLIDMAAEAFLDNAFAAVHSIGEVKVRPTNGTPARLGTKEHSAGVATPRVAVRRAGRPRGHGGADRPAASAAATVAVVNGKRVVPPLEQVRLRLVDAVESHARVSQRNSQQQGSTLIAPGVRSVQRYQDCSHQAPRWRQRLPLISGCGRPARVIFAAVIAGALLGGAGFAFNQHGGRIARAEASIVTADDAILAASADPGAATPALAAAEAALADARRSGAPSETIIALEQALERTRDAAWRISRLSDMARVGSLPAVMQNQPVRLVSYGTKAYLAGPGLYEIDPASGQLVQLLEPGQVVNGSPVGPIIHAATDRTGVVLSDGAALYQQDESGGWERLPFASPDERVLSAGQPTASFNGMLYALGTDGSILKYQNAGGVLNAQTWAGPETYRDLAFGQDLAVNDRVHVLLQDGTIHSYYMGVIDTISELPVVPVPSGELFFAASGGAQGLYVVEPGISVGGVRGRIIRFDLGGATQQFVAPAPTETEPVALMGSRAIGEASQVAVVESTGTVYLLSGNEIWTAKLPAL